MAAAIADELRVHARRAGAIKIWTVCRHRRRGADDPAGRGGGRFRVRGRAQYQAQRAMAGGRERQPPRRDEIEPRAAYFADHHANGG